MNGKVYKITNNITNEAYIGKTIRSIEKRFEEHCHGTERDDERRSLLQKAMAEYGYRHFSIELLMDGIETQERLDEIETSFMVIHGTLNEYNAIKSHQKKRPTKATYESNIFIHKDFAQINIQSITNFEQNLLMAMFLLSAKAEHGLIEVELEELARLTDTDKSYTRRLLSSIKAKTDGIYSTNSFDDVSSKQSEQKIDLFNSLDIIVNEGFVEFEINSNLKRFIKSKRETNFIKISYYEYKSISNVYSKRLYMLLSLHRKSRKVKISTDELIYFLNTPSSYSNSDFLKIILNPATAEINPYFRELKKTEIRKGKGGKLHSLEFSFKS